MLAPEAILKTSFRVSAFVALIVSGCMGAEPAPPTASQSSAIQGGTTDSTDTFSVGIIQTEDIANDMVAYCTGVMLAPNLVATARHCVAQLSSPTIDCSTSTFGALYPASDLYITTATTIDPHTLTAYNNSVSDIIVPQGSDHDSVCGNDLALLILADPITLPQYVVPTIVPPMSSAQYETTVTAIGYGVDTPTDTAGATAGTRRIKENVALACIPNDPNPSESSLDCFAANPQQAPMYLTATEFMSGDSTCEGDSGSGAFEQSNFNAGKWVAFGVLSRGGTSSDGTTCIQPIYSRFDAWGSMIASAAMQAASLGGYAVPSWATDLDAGTATPTPTADSAAAATGGDSDAAPSMSTSGGSTAGSSPDGTSCEVGSSCASGICAAMNGSASAMCVTPCSDGTCGSGSTCQSGYCFAEQVTSSTHGSSGCSLVAPPSPTPEPAAPVPAVLGGIALTAIGLRRRGARRQAGDLSAS
jgi:hypothetical protein